MKFTKEQYEILHQAFSQVLENALSGRVFRGFGICYNASLHVPRGELAYAGVIELSAGWSHHTGNDEFPVPVTADIWTGAGFDLRIDLLHYMINKIEAIQKESN